ncbi:MAG TPA: patatin-like phospholipase family protein [Solirubrobacteraceae bacterium]|nr:patatin-like phospholipase family protein [Solirubrobacteraceae bacterium]
MLLIQQAHAGSVEELRREIDHALVVQALERAMRQERLRHDQQPSCATTSQVAASNRCRSSAGPVDLVFEGGGVKGVGLAGAYAALEEEGWEPQCVAGASAGAITAALVAAGYTGAELRDEVLELQFAEFKDKGWDDRIPVIGKEISVLLDFGVYEGHRFLEWMTEKLDRKGVRTFGDLEPTGSDDPKRAFRLQVIVSDVTRHEMLVLPRDAEKIGSTPSTLSTAYAVRMSMSIPIFFEPVDTQTTPREPST